MATSDIIKDETILFLPESMCILPENQMDVPANSWLNWNDKSLEKIKNKSHITLALFYLNEKKDMDKSKHKRYFESIKQDYS
jgi:hypothetical protein